MVLRTGIILPFQYGDVKKLLMVGSPEEDRDLKLFDFTNVVRAAFNIYNFEFRNKQIDFQIPEELLVNYLEQLTTSDLTNFVIQIDQVAGDRRSPPHCATCNCSISRYLGLKQAVLNSNYGVSNEKWNPHYATTANNSNSNNKNSKFSFMSNEQLMQHHRQPADVANVVAPSNFVGLGVGGTAMKARNFSSTPSDLDEDSGAPTPPKLRLSNSLSDSMTATAAAAAVLSTSNPNPENGVDDDDDDDRNNKNSTPPPILTVQAVKPYEHSALPLPLPLPLTNNDADDDDSQLSAKSALKAAFIFQQQKEFQQQLQQHHHQHAATQQQPHHISPHHQHLHSHLYDDEHSFDPQYQRSLQYPDVAYLNEAENNGSRQRKERMSKRQKELYVEFLEQNPIVNSHRRNDPVLDGFWVRLANILNDCPNGAAKSVAEWKQAFDNWRYRVFLYARHNSQLNVENAQVNSKAFKPLTLTDKRAYNLWIRNPDTAPANIEKLPADLNCSED